MPLPGRCPSNRRLLAVLAHPDDEARILGGTLAKYAAGGGGRLDPVHDAAVLAVRTV